MRKKQGVNVPRMFRGLSDRMNTSAGGSGLAVRLEYNKPFAVQFLVTPNEFLEFDQHQFNDGGWKYVPCLGDDCPLDDDEDSDVSKTHYRFIAPVYSFKDKEVRILEGPKTMAQRIAFRYARRQDTFLRRTYDVTKLKTTPVGYDVEQAEEAAVRTRSLEIPDLERYVVDAAKRFFGDNDREETSRSSKRSSGKSAARSSLYDDDEDEFADEDIEEDERHSRSDLMEMAPRDLKRLARKYRISTEGSTRRELVTAVLRKER